MEITARRITNLFVLLLCVMTVLSATPALAQPTRHFTRPGAEGAAEAATPAAPGSQGTVAPPALPSLPSDAVDATPVAAPSTPAIPADAVRIEVGANAREVVHAHPAGTTFVFATGVHRGADVLVRSGDSYLGEPGAILDGTVPLNAAAFATSGGRFHLTGIQSEAAPSSGTPSCAPWYQGGMARCGHEQEVYRSEMLFADGVRLRHVNTPAEVGPGSWHYDVGSQTVVVSSLPSQLDMAVTNYAFSGWATRDVTIAGLHIRNYASIAQMGAIDALGTTGWVIDGVAVTGNHGYGIRIGQSTTVTNSLVSDNGHLGIAGSAEETGVTVIGNEIAHNGWLGVQPGFESGGIKVLFTHGAQITHNWVHDNGAKGIWLDGYNLDATIAYNLIERSGQTGILYEISHAAEIHHNVILDNHTTDDTSESYGNLQIVNSHDVVVHHNFIAGGGAQELTIYADDISPDVANITIRDNDITINTTWREGTYGLKDLRSDKSSPIPGILFTGNRIAMEADPGHPFAWDTRLISGADWVAAHPGDKLIG